MAVYTRIPDHELREFVGRYDLGELKNIKDILSGVENSNFFLTTGTGTYILTIYEKRVREEDLPFFIDLMHHLSDKGIPCPAPIADKQGNILQKLCNKPAALITFLHGGMSHAITPDQCHQVGKALADMHKATVDFKGVRANNLSVEGWATLIARCVDACKDTKTNLGPLLSAELQHLKSQWPAPDTLPFGVIHADLFPDNVFFEDNKLCGLIDFYFACNDFYAYDLAICINAWCFDDNYTFAPAFAKAMLDGYQSVRLLSMQEKAAMPIFLRGAALRFLLTRLYDLLHHPEGALVKPKDPMEYVSKLEFFQGHSDAI